MNYPDNEVILKNINFDIKELFFVNLFSTSLITGNKKINANPPLLKYIFVGDLSSNDSKMSVAKDDGSIVQFTKFVSQTSNKGIIKHVCICIAKKFLSFLHFETGEVFNDDISILMGLDPDLVFELLDVFYDGEKISSEYLFDEMDHDKIDNELFEFYQGDRKIESILDINDEILSCKLGYYILTDNLEYCHTFSKELISFDDKPDNIKEYLDEIRIFLSEEDNIPDSDLIDSFIESIKNNQNFKELNAKLGINSKQRNSGIKNLNKQINNLIVSTFLSYLIFPWLFKNKH